MLVFQEAFGEHLINIQSFKLISQGNFRRTVGIFKALTKSYPLGFNQQLATKSYWFSSTRRGNRYRERGKDCSSCWEICLKTLLFRSRNNTDLQGLPVAITLLAAFPPGARQHSAAPHCLETRWCCEETGSSRTCLDSLGTVRPIPGFLPGPLHSMPAVN